MMYPVAAVFIMVAHAAAMPASDGSTKTVQDADAQGSGLFASKSQLLAPQATHDPERARVENTFKEYRGYELAQGALINILQPKPIVDTIQEHEKYGNDGSKAAAIGEFVVRGSESLSKLLNAAIDKPKMILSQLSKGTTDYLNQVGASLIGL